MDINQDINDAILVISNDLQNVCRICAQNFMYMKTIHDFTTCSIQPLIKINDMLDTLQIPIDEKCPYFICSLCETELFNAYNLKIRSEYSLQIFHQLIQQENPLPLLETNENPTISSIDLNEILKNDEIMINFDDISLTAADENLEDTSKIFNTLYEIKQKLSIIEPNTCVRCVQTFATPERYEKHMKLHTDIVCFICKRVLKRKSHLKQHMKVHNDPVCNYTCNICQMNLNYPNILIEHRNLHVVISISCNSCKETFTNIIETLCHRCLKRNRKKTTELK